MHMKSPLAPLIAAVALIASQPCNAQSLKDGQPTLKTGNWTVVRSIDPMTDKVSCTGIYKTDYRVQLSEKALFVNISGGLQYVILRFGDSPPQPMRLPQAIEKDTGAVMIDGADFTQALNTTRLRVEVLTLVRGLKREDLDITGIQSAIEHIRAGCPASTGVDPVARPPTPAEPICPEPLLSRLRAAGVTTAQINAACRR